VTTTEKDAETHDGLYPELHKRHGAGYTVTCEQMRIVDYSAALMNSVYSSSETREGTWAELLTYFLKWFA
jgi:hypothetical protein